MPDDPVTKDDVHDQLMELNLRFAKLGAELQVEGFHSITVLSALVQSGAMGLIALEAEDTLRLTIELAKDMVEKGKAAGIDIKNFEVGSREELKEILDKADSNGDDNHEFKDYMQGLEDKYNAK